MIMNILNSLSTNIKNVFVGSHRGEDFKLEPLPKKSNNKLNDLGVDPNEWFDDRPHNPLDDMPIATNDRFDMYGSSDADDAYNPPRPEEEIAEDIAEDITIHEKMYRMATAKYNPFAVGGSESIHDFEGGSENVQKL